jgi:hypothetical protein
MTRAEVESVEPDPGRARDFLLQAKKFLADAELPKTSLEGSVVLYWNACIAAMDAVLANAGLRIGRGDDSHVVRVEAAQGVLGVGYSELFERLGEWRRERHEVSYAAVTPSAADVAAMQGDARDVIAAVESVI